MAQFMKAKLTQKEGKMAAEWFFTQMDHYTKAILQEINVTEKA